MGLALGIFSGFIGMGLLLIPFIIDIYVSRRTENKDYERALEASAGIIALAVLFMVGGLIIVAVESGKGIAESGGGALIAGLSSAGGSKEGGEGGGEGGAEGSNLQSLLAAKLLSGKGGEAGEAGEAGELGELGELAEFA